MKTGHHLIAFFLITLIYNPNKTLLAQDAKSITKNNLLTNQFIFTANYVVPSYGGIKFISPGYDIQFSKDTVSVYLPYYGRAYTPMFGTDGGIKFTSTHFGYTIKERKKGKGWDISIQPKDANDVREINLQVSPTGNTTAQVTSLSRQSISFQGNIRPKN